MTFRKMEGDIQLVLKLNNIPIKNMKSFVYLGSKLTCDNNSNTVGIRRRNQLATGAIRDLNILLKETWISINI